jgi:deoxyribodipyrimidine photo-lyase
VNEKTGGKLQRVKDHLIFSPTEVLREGQDAYKVFTPYSRVWLSQLTSASAAPYPIEDTGRHADAGALRDKALASGIAVLQPETGAAAMLESIGYREVSLPEWPVENARVRLTKFMQNHVQAYPTQRDLPAVHGTSRLSPYLRFGLVSVRECLAAAQAAHNADKWIAELIWREFYATILYHYPHTPTQEFNPAFNGTIDWSHDPKKLKKWKQGKTGYPIIDAAMRELLSIGWMHNRTRMIVASFLTKDLNLNWQMGAEYFESTLIDYDACSNWGNWNYVAGVGSDPREDRYFNTLTQAKRYDPNGDYVKHWLPELADLPADKVHEGELL